MKTEKNREGVDTLCVSWDDGRSAALIPLREVGDAEMLVDELNSFISKKEL
jgi:hypothetical protein